MSDLLCLAVIQDTKVFSLQAGQNTPSWSVTSTIEIHNSSLDGDCGFGPLLSDFNRKFQHPSSVSAWGADRGFPPAVKGSEQVSIIDTAKTTTSATARFVIRILMAFSSI